MLTYSTFIILCIALTTAIPTNESFPEHSETAPKFAETREKTSKEQEDRHIISESVETNGGGSAPLPSGEPYDDDYHWSAAASEECPLNCTDSRLKCWRLSGYLIPFVCVPADFNPNYPIGSIERRRWEPLRWLLRATNAELVTMALLLLNTLLVLVTCLCVCARRTCRKSNY